MAMQEVQTRTTRRRNDGFISALRQACSGRCKSGCRAGARVRAGREALQHFLLRQAYAAPALTLASYPAKPSPQGTVEKLCTPSGSAELDESCRGKGI